MLLRTLYGSLIILHFLKQQHNTMAGIPYPPPSHPTSPTQLPPPHLTKAATQTTPINPKCINKLSPNTESETSPTPKSPKEAFNPAPLRLGTANKTETRRLNPTKPYRSALSEIPSHQNTARLCCGSFPASFLESVGVNRAVRWACAQRVVLVRRVRARMLLIWWRRGILLGFMAYWGLYLDVSWGLVMYWKSM